MQSFRREAFGGKNDTKKKPCLFANKQGFRCLRRYGFIPVRERE